MNVSVVFLQGILLQQTLLDIARQLPDPTLIYHDGTTDRELEEVAKSLGKVKLILLSKSRPRTVPEVMPFGVERSRSTILIAGLNGCDYELLRNLRPWHMWDARDPMLVLAQEADVHCWLSAAWKYTRAANVTVIVVNTQSSFHTWFPYRIDECTNVMVVSPLAKDILFPQKIPENLNGCSIIAVRSILRPMVIDDFRGLETRLVRSIVQKLNLTLRLVKLPKNMKVWNFFSKDGMPIGGMEMLWENTADIMFCNTAEYYEPMLWADLLPSHLQDELSWFVPAPDAIPRATAIFWAFSSQVWAMVFVSFVAVLICSYAFPCCGRGSEDCGLLRTMALYLNLPTSQPNSRVLSIFAMMTYAYSLHITTAYQSSLISFLSDIPRQHPIKTPEELAASNLHVEFLFGANKALLSRPEAFMKTILKKPERVRYVGSLQLRKIAKQKFALLGPKTAFTYAVDSSSKGSDFRDEHGRRLVQVLHKSFSLTDLTMYLSRGHPLLPIFRHSMTKLIEGGFVEFFINVDSGPADSKVSRNRQPFGVANVVGAFFVLIGFLVVSLVIFLFELVISAYCRR